MLGDRFSDRWKDITLAVCFHNALVEILLLINNECSFMPEIHANRVPAASLHTNEPCVNTPLRSTHVRQTVSQ